MSQRVNFVSFHATDYYRRMGMNPAVPRFAAGSVYVPGGWPLDDPGSPVRCEPLTLRCCGFLAHNRQWNHPQIFSPFWRLYYNFAPGHRIRHAGRTIPLTPARFVLVPENVLFHCESPAGTPGHLFVHFNLLPGWTPHLQEPRTIRADPLLGALARELAREIAHAAGPRAGHLAAALVHWVFGRLRGEESSVRAPAPQLRAVLAHIANHLADDLSNPRLARIAGMSLRGFVRAFRAQVGAPPQAHVRTLRVQEAARRLAHGDESIDQLAEALGFPNRYYFTRRFTRQIGSSPAAFRHAMQHGVHRE